MQKHPWAMNVKHIPFRQNGWGHLTAAIDCHDCQIMGNGFALRGRAKQAERTFEAACLPRLRTLCLVTATSAL
ncbi:MAG: hypothetical protein NPIRA06_00570 [Nitrospirales bacterium]|nr:MAG: hypothetical protein NPIRA06_00570 [Nitrospirales bacterium]